MSTISDNNHEHLMLKESDANHFKAEQAKKEAYERARERFEKIWQLIHDLFGDVVALREMRASLPEMAVVVKAMAGKRPLLEQLFHEFLQLVANGKIKNVQACDYNPDHIFNACQHQIIQITCLNNDPGRADFYKYNLISFYISMSKMLDACERTEAAYPDTFPTLFPGLGHFFEDAYSSIGHLLSLYDRVFALARYGYKFSGSQLYKCGTRHEFSMLMELRHTLYEGTPLDTGEANPSNVAMAGIRQFIEVWLRKSFDAWMRPDDSLIPLSAIFTALRDNINEIKNDHIAGGIKTIEDDINSLAAINECANTFLHSNLRQLFWVPYIAFWYLTPTVHYYSDYYTPKIGTWHIVPPFIPKQCKCWQAIYKAIMKPKDRQE